MVKKKLVCGVGINDADYVTQIRESYYVSGIRKQKTLWICPYYSRWTGMLRRCYSSKYHDNHNTYEDCYVFDKWLTFSNFKKWMEQQDWKNKDLDKDLLVYKNKIYSPDRCIFVDQRINKFILQGDICSRVHPLGVRYQNKTKTMISERSNPFQAYIRYNDYDRRIKHLGMFSDSMEAHRAWQLAKIAQAKQLQTEQIDAKVIQGLQRIIDKIQNDYDNNLETIDF